MKRFLSFLMALCLLLTLFPMVVPIAAEDNALLKDESGVSAAGVETTSVALSVYDALYVGADGSKTANGGSLIGLYSAFTKGDASVTLSSGTTSGLWKNKMDPSGATDATLRDTYGNRNWEWGEKKGIGYEMTATQWAVHSSSGSSVEGGCIKMGMTMPSAWADLSDFTVEQFALLDAIPSDGVLSHQYSAVRLDLLLGLWLPSNYVMYGAESYCFRWSYGTTQTWSHTLTSSAEYNYRDAYLNGNAAVPLGMRYYKETGDTGITYGLQYSNGNRYENEVYTLADYASVKQTVASGTRVFTLFNGMPGELYGVRVYDAPLTEAEFNHNACIDLLAYADIDVSSYAALDSAQKSTVDTFMVTNVDVFSKEMIVGCYDFILRHCIGTLSLEDSYYVSDGLVILLTSYNGFDTGSTVVNGSGVWYNPANPDQAATLNGTAWYKDSETGGLTIHHTIDEFQQYKNDKTNIFGIYLPTACLPAEDYTLELVANPVGLTTVNENGERERYIDTITGNGVYNTMGGIGIGPLRCLQFACYRPDGKDGNLERRWYYSHNKNLTGLNWNYRVRDTVWQGLAYDQVLTLTVSHDYDYVTEDVTAASFYSFYDDYTLYANMAVSAEDYKTPAESTQPYSGTKSLFRVMAGVCGSTFAVRMYDRVLTEAERRQNHAADILYYYDLDTSFLDTCVSIGLDKTALLDAIADLDFNMTKEEAQRAMDSCLASSWLAYEGVGVRKTGNHAIRFYFTPNSEFVSALENNGFKVELGALVNVEKASAPLYGYADYSLVMYSEKTANTAFLVDEDTYALTVRYSAQTKQDLLAEISVCGYIRVTAADGEEFVVYISTETKEMTPDSLFAVYNGIKDKEVVLSDVDVANRVALAVEKCYEKRIVHVKAGAAAGGDGTLAAPYHSFADGFAACKEIMATTALPTRVVLLLADGEYGVYDTRSLAAAEMPYRFLTFEITSENGNSTLTTTKDITESFAKYSDNIWVCQLEKEDGAYPDFRYLYVDGKIADLSYSGGRYVSEPNQYVSMFERDYDAPYAKAKALYDAGTLTANSTSDYTRADLIASFNSYRTDFLALDEMKAQYAAGNLQMDSTCASTDAEYIAYYEAHKLNRIAYDDLAAQYAAYGYFSITFEPSAAYKDYANYEAYSEAFVALRTKIINLGHEDTFTGESRARYEPQVFSRAIEQGKYYLNEAIVGDLTAEIAAGKARNKAAYEALLAEYNAADEAGKAELQAELDLAALKADDAAETYTWVRYALEGYGPEMHLAGQWWNNIIHVAGIDYGDTVVDKNGATHVAVYLELEEYANYHVHKTYTMVNRYVHMKDALSYVDLEGEYYYDDLNGKLYYYSESGVSGKRFERGTHDYMFYFDDISNVTISGLHITGVDDAYLSHNDGVNSLGGTGAVGEPITEQVPAFDRSAIVLDDCYGFTVRDCTFDELGGRAIYGRGVLANILVEGCSFERLGANAVQLGNGKKEVNWVPGSHTIENVTITDNYIHDVAREYYTCSAIWLNQGKDVTITYNTIDKCSYSGMGVGYTFGVPKSKPGGKFYHNYNVEIAYNYISGFMHELGDGGGIYVTGGNSTTEDTEYFNYVHHNYIPMTNQTGDGLGHMLVGIYFDGSSSNWHCYENVIAEQSYGAASGENDSLYAAGDPYTVALRLRRRESYYIYLQHITGQKTHNILCEGNYILNVRATNITSQKAEVYKSYVDAERNLAEKDTHYVVGISYIPAAAQTIAAKAGAAGHKGDASLLLGNNY